MKKIVRAAAMAVLLVGVLVAGLPTQSQAQEVGAVGRQDTAMSRVAFRTFLRLRSRQATPAQRAAVQKALSSQDAFDAVFEGCHGEYTTKVKVGGTVTDFLQWLFDNSDNILALIAKIMALFQGADLSPIDGDIAFVAWQQPLQVAAAATHDAADRAALRAFLQHEAGTIAGTDCGKTLQTILSNEEVFAAVYEGVKEAYSPPRRHDPQAFGNWLVKRRLMILPVLIKTVQMELAAEQIAVVQPACPGGVCPLPAGNKSATPGVLCACQPQCLCGTNCHCGPLCARPGVAMVARPVVTAASLAARGVRAVGRVVANRIEARPLMRAVAGRVRSRPLVRAAARVASAPFRRWRGR